MPLEIALAISVPMTPMPTMPTPITMLDDSRRALTRQAVVLEFPPRLGRMPSTPRLLAPLERLYREADWVARTDRDAIRYPLRYPQPDDREIVGLLSACMAYGRVDLFGPWIEWLLDRMGPSPAAFMREFDAAKHARRFDGLHYRFNRPPDAVAFCASARGILARHGSLRAFFAEGYSPADADVGPALERFVDAFLSREARAAFRGGRLSYGYRHWF